MFASLPSLISSAVIAICSLLNVLAHFGLHLYIYATPDRQAQVNPRGVNTEPLFSSAIVQVALGGVAAGWAFKIGRRERRAVKARARAGAGRGPA